MIKETQEERILRRKAQGYHNPKKDNWARRKRFYKGTSKPWSESIAEPLATEVESEVKIKRNRFYKFWKWLKGLFKRSHNKSN